MKVTCCVVTAFLLVVSARGADEVITLKAARMFDGKSNALVQNAVIVVEGDKIVDAGSNLPIPSSARVIVSARTKCKGVQVDGGFGHETDRCIEISDSY